MNDVAKAMREVFEKKAQDAEAAIRTLEGVVLPAYIKPLQDMMLFYFDQFRPDLIAAEKEFEEMKLRLEQVSK